MFGIRLLTWVFLAAILVVPFTFYFLTLQRALSRCAPESRTLAPGLVWLMAIPWFGAIWSFVVVTKLSKSLHNEFTRRNMSEDQRPAYGVGMAMCILYLVALIPHLHMAGSFALLIVWIIYWVKIARYSRKLQNAVEALPNERMQPTS